MNLPIDRKPPCAAARWVALGALVVLLFNVVVFPRFPKWMGYEGQWPTPLDLRWEYGPEDVTHYLRALGASGRKVQWWGAVVVDSVYPVVYAATGTALLWLLRRRFSGMVLLPWGVAAFDWMENAAIIGLLQMYPEVPSALAKAAALATSLKWLAAVIAVGYAVALILRQRM